jgi:hypothetical protein
MNAKNKINWSTSFIERVFHDLHIGDAGKLWNLKEGDIDTTFSTVKELSSSSGRNFYSTVYMKINKSKYRLKRASGKYFKKLQNEHDMIAVLPELHITPPLVAAYSVNKKKSEYLLLLKYPPGFMLLKNLIEYNLHPTIIADFEVRKKDVIKKISIAMHKMHYSNYYYPHWYSDHIMVKSKSNEIALIDLEDFCHLNQCPWYYHLELCSWLVRHKQWSTLQKSLASAIFTKKYMKEILND